MIWWDYSSEVPPTTTIVLIFWQHAEHRPNHFKTHCLALCAKSIRRNNFTNMIDMLLWLPSAVVVMITVFVVMIPVFVVMVVMMVTSLLFAVFDNKIIVMVMIILAICLCFLPSVTMIAVYNVVGVAMGIGVGVSVAMAVLVVLVPVVAMFGGDLFSFGPPNLLYIHPFLKLFDKSRRFAHVEGITLLNEDGMSRSDRMLELCFELRRHHLGSTSTIFNTTKAQNGHKAGSTKTHWSKTSTEEVRYSDGIPKPSITSKIVCWPKTFDLSFVILSHLELPKREPEILKIEFED